MLGGGAVLVFAVFAGVDYVLLAFNAGGFAVFAGQLYGDEVAQEVDVFV